MRSSRASLARPERAWASKPTLRSRKSFHSSVEKAARPRASSCSTSRLDNWMARRASTPKGRPFFSWAIEAS